MPSIPDIKLIDGSSIPQLGFGTSDVYLKGYKPILDALRQGFRYLDTAENYRHREKEGIWAYAESQIGLALKEWGGKREDVFITTKFGTGDGKEDPKASLERSLKLMGVDYVDLFLIHDPQWVSPLSLTEAWRIMQDLKRQGLCRSIGISNVFDDVLEAFLKNLTPSDEIPSVNQIEFHPYCAHQEKTRHTVELCQKYKIAVSPHTSLASLRASPDGLVDEVVQRIADNRKATPGQILLAWAAQCSGGPVVTATSKPTRLTEDIKAFEMVGRLTDEELAQISEAGKGRTYRKDQEAYDADLSKVKI